MCMQCATGATTCESLDESTACEPEYNLIFDSCEPCGDITEGCVHCEDEVCLECLPTLFIDEDG